MKTSYILFVILVLIFFIVGWFSHLFYLNEYSNITKESPISILTKEKISPKDRISENQILVLKDKIIIEMEDVSVASYLNTNSMDSFIDEGANGLEIIPKSAYDIQVGDIIAYRFDLINNLIVHRVIKISSDEKGWYAITKGDNSLFRDPFKVRFNQIEFVLVGVIY